MTGRAALALALAASMSCTEGKSPSGGPTQTSPNASILPAPLASAGELPGPALAASVPFPADSAGKMPVPAAAPEQAPVDRPLPDDPPIPPKLAGLSLEAVFRWADVPPLPNPADAPVATLREVLQKLELTVRIEIAAGRMRFVFDSTAFPLPRGTELRAKTSLYGHALVWPRTEAYRVLSLGSARALLVDRRADVAPLLRAKVTPAGAGSVLGHRTIKSDVETSLGVVTLEQTTVAGTGGDLLCRLLVELVGAEPTTEACRPERVPLAAYYRWTPSGTFSFLATSLTDHREIEGASLRTPPHGALFKPGELPPSSSSLLVAPGDLSRFRARATKTVPAPKAPSEGLMASNPTDRLLYVLVDGLPVAWVPPRSRVHVEGLPRGTYSIAWRDFLGTTVLPPEPVDLPALLHAVPPELDAGH